VNSRGSLYLFVFLLFLGIGTASPIVPLFARSMGASYTQIGMLGASFGLAFVIFAIPLGALSDRFGRKALVIVGGTVVPLAAAGYLLAATVYHVVNLRFAEGLSLATLLPTIEALATELASTGKVGSTMGWVSALYNAGFAGGSILAGTVTEWLGFHAAFLVYLIMGIAALAVAFTFPREILPAGAMPAQTKVLSGRFAWHDIHALLGYITGAVYIFDLGTMLTFLPVYARSLGLSLFATGLLFSFFFMTRIGASLGAGLLSDRIGRYPVLSGGLLACGAGCAVIALGRQAWVFLASGIMGLGLGTTYPVSIALISDGVPIAQRGLAMGVFETVGGVAFMIATAAGGFLADHLDPRAPYVLALVVSLIWGVLIATIRFREKHS
jgi:MFS family permease